MSALCSLVRPFTPAITVLLLGAWSCGGLGTGAGMSGDRPLLLLTGLLLVHSSDGLIPTDASQDFGAVKVRVVIRRYSTDEELQEIRRLAEAGDEPGFHKAFGKMEVASVEYPTAGGLRQRCYAAVEQPSPQGVRILLFSEGIVSPVMRLLSSRITEFSLSHQHEGEGWIYRARILITEENDIAFDRISPGTPGQITNVRPIR